MRLLMTLGLIALANATLTITVTASWIFKPFRDHAKENAWPIFSKLITCPYCFSHWGGLGLFLLAVPFSDPRWFIPSWFIIVTLTVPIMAGMAFCLSYLSSFTTEDDEA